MGVNQMTGQPWHKERIHRADGDARRYKGRCQFFDYDGNFCDKKKIPCYGTVVYIPTPEGKKKAVYTTKYERNPVNRAAAIAAHGAVCMACGFDFGKMYGEYGEGFIEVHHAKPLFENSGEIIPDPEKDLLCLCSNCHRMVHRFRNKVLSLEELKEIIRHAKG